MLEYSAHQGYTTYSSLENKRILITGGATGIGAALVEAFVAQGARVAFVDINQAAAEALANGLVAKGLSKPEFSFCDVSDTASLKKTIAIFQETLGAFDVLINNVANDQRYITEDMSEAEWLESVSINLHPAFFAAQSVIPGMKQQGSGVIINISSVNVKFAPAQLVSYITAKAGMNGMTKALAQEVGQYNIRVNSILPGWVATQKQLEKWLTEEEEKKLKDRMCIKKRLAAHDIAKLALFLASDDAAMITAQEFVVDGGRM